MKKKLLLSLGLIVVIVASITIGAYAASNLQEIKAYLNKDLKIQLDGDVFAVTDSSGKATYPITYNGTTYLPVRSVGEAIGLKVGFDSASNTVLLGETTANGTTSVGLSRSNPAPVGTSVKFAKKDIFDDYEVALSVDQVIRGDEAWTMILAANAYNDAPIEGHEYILVKLTATVNKNAKADATLGISGHSFTVVSTSGKDYDFTSVVEPDPVFDSQLYVGASNTGWAAFLVKTDDVNPLLAYGRSYDGTGGAWFKIN